MGNGVKINRQWLVLDCRAVNLQFRDPPRTELGSLSSLAELYIPEGKSLFVSTSDIRVRLATRNGAVLLPP